MKTFNQAPIKGNNPYIRSIHQHTDLIWLDSSPTPAQLSEFVKKDLPLVLDLGCGAGNFLRDSALMFPEERFVGFELRYKRLVRAAQKIKKRGLSNVRLAQMRAENLGDWVQPNSVARIHVNFPDPWAKTKQRKHRMIQAGFLAQIQKLLTEKGAFFLKTDHQEYFESTVELLKQTAYFTVTEFSRDLHNSPYEADNIPTEFEQLFLSKGLPVYHLKARPCP